MGTGAFEGFLSTRYALDAFAAPSMVQALLDFEAALARAQAAEGLVPVAEAQTIGRHCRAELFDIDATVAAAGRVGDLATAVVAALKQRVAADDATALPWVNWASTSQDAIDSAMAVVTQRVHARVDTDLARLIGSLLALAAREAGTPMLARALMQPASATTLGFKVAGSRKRYYQDNGEDALIMWRTPATLSGSLADVPNAGPVR